jgi:hypothetical protein
LNAAFAMAILDLISRVHLASFVNMVVGDIIKQKRRLTNCVYFDGLFYIYYGGGTLNINKDK